MDSIINAAKDLGLLIQGDKRYKDFIKARGVYRADKELQGLLRKIKDKSATSGASIDSKEFLEGEETKVLYSKIFSNKNLLNFQTAEDTLRTLVKDVLSIIETASYGHDPESISPAQTTEECAKSCLGCMGCH